MELNKQTYPLPEAAKILRHSTDDLLQKGAEGSLCIFVPVPDNVDVFNIGSTDLHPEKRIFQRRLEPTRAENVNYLFLDRTDCKRLLNGAPLLSGVFNAGGTFDDNGNWKILIPDLCIDRSQKTSFAPSGDRKFALYGLGTKLEGDGTLTRPKAIHVTVDSLIITHKELSTLRDRIAQVPVRVPELTSLCEHPNTSENLKSLYQLYSDIWIRSLAGNFTPPSISEISGRLVDEYQFSKNLAECGAHIIFSTELIKDSDDSSLADAPLLDILISCSLELWRITTENPYPNPSNSKVTYWLGKNIENSPNGKINPLPARVLETAPSLLRPSSAPKGRRASVDRKPPSEPNT